MSNNLSVTLGADPELMLQDQSGSIVSAIDILRNDKNNPITNPDGSRLYADNVLCEFAFPPSANPTEATERLRSALIAAQKVISKEADITLAAKAAHIFDKLPPKPSDELVMQWLNDEVPADAVAPEWQVGCNPNYDVYAGTIRKQSPFRDGLRTGSFHIHIGNAKWRNRGERMLLTSETRRQAIRLLDVYLGCLSVILDRDETSKTRRKLYGGAGEYRPTDYGVEYRVLSNYPLRSPRMAKLCFEVAEWTMQWVGTEFGANILTKLNQIDVQRCINETDVKAAQAICQKAMIPWRFIHEAEKPNNDAIPLREAWGF